MATYSEVTITFDDDWVDDDQLIINASEMTDSQIFTWVVSRSATNEVTTGSPTANQGETAAINFASAFSLDNPSGYVVTVQNVNEVLIQSETEGEIFNLAQLFSGTGVLSVSYNNIYSVNKINVRSPYFINIKDTDLTKAVITLYIYTGNSVNAMVETTYSMESDAYNGEVNFDISHLVRDFLDVEFSGEYSSQVVWVNYQITRYINGIGVVPNLIRQVLAFDGYGYFQDGVNPFLGDKLLQSNTKMMVMAGNYFYIPVQQDKLSQIDLKYNGTVVTTEVFTSTTNSSDAIRYIGYINQTECSGIVDYMFQDGSSFLFEDGNVFTFNYVDVIDEFFITYSDATTESVYVTTVEEAKYTPYRVTFINKFGAFQSLWMFKRSDLSLNIEMEDYRSNIMSNNTYSTSKHQYSTLYVSGREELSLNSGFYTEDYNDVFRQLMLSERIWIHYEGDLLPVNMKSNSLSFKTRLNDKLINYKIDFEFAFDKINSIY